MSSRAKFRLFPEIRHRKQMKKTGSPESGFSIVEVLVMVGIGTLLLAFAYGLLGGGARQAAHGETLLLFGKELNSLSSQIHQDLRACRSFGTFDSTGRPTLVQDFRDETPGGESPPASSSLRIDLFDGGKITYRRTGGLTSRGFTSRGLTSRESGSPGAVSRLLEVPGKPGSETLYGSEMVEDFGVIEVRKVHRADSGTFGSRFLLLGVTLASDGKRAPRQESRLMTFFSPGTLATSTWKPL